MANLETEFHELLTPAGTKQDSSTTQAHRRYINSSLLESVLKMNKSHLFSRLAFEALCMYYSIILITPTVG